MEYKAGGAAITSPGADGQPGNVISGLAATYSLDLQNDKIKPGAFSETLKANPSVPILFSHNVEKPIGRTTALQETDAGLYFKAILSDTSVGADVQILVADSVLQGVSIGYSTPTEKQKGEIRYLETVELYELSVVVFPAQLDARLSASMLDKCLIANHEYKLRSGLQPGKNDWAAYMGAMRRELERLTYSGLTLRQEIARVEAAF